MVPAQVLMPRPGDRVGDFCAAPGGKTLQMADLASSSRIYATDLIEARVGLMEREFLRLGISNIEVATADAAEKDSWPFENALDKILLDVPCSGLGLLGSKPELKLRWDPKTVKEQLIPVQKQILANASQYLKAGGELVYSTCTLNPAENEEVIEAFLREHPEFTLGTIRGRLAPAVESRLLELDPALATGFERGYFTLWPHRVRSEGFFVALLKKGNDHA